MIVSPWGGAAARARLTRGTDCEVNWWMEGTRIKRGSTRTSRSKKNNATVWIPCEDIMVGGALLWLVPRALLQHGRLPEVREDRIAAKREGTAFAKGWGNIRELRWRDGMHGAEDVKELGCLITMSAISMGGYIYCMGIVYISQTFLFSFFFFLNHATMCVWTAVYWRFLSWWFIERHWLVTHSMGPRTTFQRRLQAYRRRGGTRRTFAPPRRGVKLFS